MSEKDRAVENHGARRLGAYGLRLTGVETARRYLVRAPANWPDLAIEWVRGVPRIEHDIAEDDWAEYRVLGGGCCVRLDREPLSARFTTAGVFSADAMVHPGLGMLAAITNRWLGRDAFHAGAFLAGAGAWGVMGAREAGKSTVLGYLATKGVGIVSDDVLIVGDGHALSGPRCVDLRHSAADWMGQGVDLGVLGDRRRWRVQVSPVPAAVPLQGWIVPVWGDRVELEAVPPAGRLPLLYANLGLTRIPRSPERLLRLAALPCLIFRRPRRWEAMDEAVVMLLDRVVV
jgi:hypothetical protein